MPSAPFLPVISCNNIEVCSETYGRPRAFWLHVWMAMNPFISALSFPNTTKEGFLPPYLKIWIISTLKSRPQKVDQNLKLVSFSLEVPLLGTDPVYVTGCKDGWTSRTFAKIAFITTELLRNRTLSSHKKTVRQTCTSCHGKISMMS